MKKFNEFINEAEFWRLSDKTIGNELYVQVKNLKSLQDTVKAGNDFDPEAMQRIIDSLQGIKDKARKFSNAGAAARAGFYPKKNKELNESESTDLKKATEIVEYCFNFIRTTKGVGNIDSNELENQLSDKFDLKHSQCVDIVQNLSSAYYYGYKIEDLAKQTLKSL